MDSIARIVSMLVQAGHVVQFVLVKYLVRRKADQDENGHDEQMKQEAKREQLVEIPQGLGVFELEDDQGDEQIDEFEAQFWLIVYLAHVDDLFIKRRARCVDACQANWPRLVCSIGRYFVSVAQLHTFKRPRKYDVQFVMINVALKDRK